MAKIFISYRRSDTQMVAGRLREALARRVGEAAIFRDKDSIGAGEDWTKAIAAHLGTDVVVLALIGPTWASARGENGARRLDDPADWNRVELEQALQSSARVIPLLVDDARMPNESDLPETLRALARRNALKLRDDDWDSDVERLLRAIAVDKPLAPRRWALPLAAAIAIVAAGAGYWWFAAQDEPVAPAATDAVAAKTSAYVREVRSNLADEQQKALQLLVSSNPADKANAMRAVAANIARIDEALKAFPNDAGLETLAGYAAKNVFESSRAGDLLSPQQRLEFVQSARRHFENALRLDPHDAGALNGMGNVSFYEGRLDDAIRYHEDAIKSAKGRYAYAENDLQLVRRVKSGELPFAPYAAPGARVH